MMSRSLIPALQSAIVSLASTPVRSSLSAAAFAIGTAALSSVLLLSEALADLSRRQLVEAGAINIEIRAVDKYWRDGIAFSYPDPATTIPISLAATLANILDARATVFVVDSAAIEAEIGGRERGIAIVSRRPVGANSATDGNQSRGATISKRLELALSREYGANRPDSLRLGAETVAIVGLEPSEHAGTALAVYVSAGVLERLPVSPTRYITVVPNHQVIDDQYKAIFKDVEREVRRDTILRGRALADSRGPAQIGRVTQAVTVFRVSFAALALLCIVVAGLGAANVVLLSTIQRAREIGVRRSVGATRTSIRVQFATEAIVVALAGGVLGLVLGRVFVGGVAAVIASRSNVELMVGYSAFAILIPLLTAVSIGLIAASFPAARAARVDPSVALRDE